MQERLVRQLHTYLQDQHPDLLWRLQEEKQVTHFLVQLVSSMDGFIDRLLSENKAPSEIEELCLSILTRPMKPSRFQYLKGLLEDEFPAHFQELHSCGVLMTELINMISACNDVFKEFDFSETTENDRILRYAVIGEVNVYLSLEPVS